MECGFQGIEQTQKWKKSNPGDLRIREVLIIKLYLNILLSKDPRDFKC